MVVSIMMTRACNLFILTTVLTPSTRQLLKCQPLCLVASVRMDGIRVGLMEEYLGAHSDDNENNMNAAVVIFLLGLSSSTDGLQTPQDLSARQAGQLLFDIAIIGHIHMHLTAPFLKPSCLARSYGY